MNLFQIVFLDTILLIFPILVFLIYLSTDRNITNNKKNIYFSLTLFSSFYLAYKYGANDPKTIPILVLNSIVIFSYLEEKYIFANIFGFLIILLYSKYFNAIWFISIIYLIMFLIYSLRKTCKVKPYLFVFSFLSLNCILYLIWIYKYNNIYFDIKNIILIMTSYFFVVIIICLMYETGKRILETHFTFKELQKEKQIRLSLFKITHEIKNPIAVCKGYLDMINVNDKKQIQRYIPIIKSEIERLLSILQDFLLVNGNNLDFDIMDLNLLLDENIDKIKPMLKEKNIELYVDIFDDEIFINGDYNKLSQAILNIIKNSVESISNTNGMIKIISKKIDNLYFIEIIDNGEGMDSEILKKIQEPFFTTKKRGSGLGVPLVYEIVMAHNAKIEYESKLGMGTKVTLQFNLCQ